MTQCWQGWQLKQVIAIGDGCGVLTGGGCGVLIGDGCGVLVTVC